jgi:hypothetical protein
MRCQFCCQFNRVIPVIDADRQIYNGVLPISADGLLAMIIPVAILAKTATWALSSRGLEALVHSRIARGNTNQNIVLCALKRRTECALVSYIQKAGSCCLGFFFLVLCRISLVLRPPPSASFTYCNGHAHCLFQALRCSTCTCQCKQRNPRHLRICIAHALHI